VLALRWAGSPLLLQAQMLVLVLVLVLLSRWIGRDVVVHCSILRVSTTRWSSYRLPLLGFLVGADGIVRDHDIAHKL
jgi:hypothetical protein